MAFRHSYTAAVIAALGLGLTACGSSHSTSSTQSGAAASGNPTIDALVALLPNKGELPGFTASEGVVTADSVVAAISRDTSVEQMASNSKQLRADGFRDDVSQAQADAKIQTAGTAYVGEFSSPANAAKYRTYFFGLLSKPGPETGTAAQNSFTSFSVPGVPGAEGDAQVSHVSQGAASNVQWIEGECLFELGAASSSSSKPVVAPLIAGAQAIYTRTEGACGS